MPAPGELNTSHGFRPFKDKTDRRRNIKMIEREHLGALLNVEFDSVGVEI